MIITEKNIKTVAVFKKAFFSLLIQIIGIASSFLLLVILAQLLGVKDYGNYIYVITWINILVLIAKFGLDFLLVRYVAAYQGEKKWGYLKGVIFWSFRSSLLISLFLGSGLVVFVWCFADHIDAILVELFYVAVLLIPLISSSELILAVLRGLHYIVLYQIIGYVLRYTFLLGIVIFIFYFLESPLSSFLVICLNVVISLFILILSIVLLIRYLPRSVKSTPAILNITEWKIAVLPFFFIDSMWLIVNRTDTVMLGMMLTTKEAGIYASASNISTLVVFGLHAFNTFMAPTISKLYTTGEKQELQQLITLAAWGSLGFATMAILFLAGMGKFILSLFGEDFVAGYMPLVTLLLSQMVIATTGLAGMLMVMTGKQKIFAKIMGLSAVANVILNYILIPLLGMTGAAIATGISVIFWHLAVLWHVQKWSGINPTVFYFK